MICFNLGNSYLNQKNLPKALEFYKITITKAPDYLEAYIKKGELLTNLKIHNEAIDCLKSALKIACLLYTSPSPRDGLLSRMPSSA